jgi:hypothetical protein
VCLYGLSGNASIFKTNENLLNTELISIL